MREFSNKFLSQLTGPFKGLNLTRIIDSDSFYEKQILDSVLPVEKSTEFYNSIKKNKKIIDIGFGGGFPILPLAHKFQDCEFLGLEARGKKVLAVSEIAKSLKLNNVRLQHRRIENVFVDIPVTITLKAVGKVEDYLSLVKTNQKVQVFFYKGPMFYDLENLDKVLKSWKIIEERSIDVPSTEGRLLIGFENKNVLRGTNKINKDLVIVSELF